MGSILGPNRVIAKDVKSCMLLLLLCQMRDINSLKRGECIGPKQAQLITMHNWDLKISRAIKGLVVCNSWDLEP